jgi:hypothetical protein
MEEWVAAERSGAPFLADEHSTETLESRTKLRSRRHRRWNVRRGGVFPRDARNAGEL